MKRNKASILVLLISMLLAAHASADSFKVAMMNLPTQETFKNLLAAIADLTKNSFDIQVVPPARTAYLIENKQVDFTLPMVTIKDPAKVAALKYAYSTPILYQSAFVLITNRGKPIDEAELIKGNTKGYKIEMDVSNVDQFEFKGIPSTNIEASLKRVSDGSIDGYIHSQTTTTPVLKKLGLPNLKRQLYEYFDLVLTVQKGGNGEAVNAMLSSAIKTLRGSGKYDQIMGDIVKAAKYDDWQP
jgi:hypothetical protein